QLLPCSRLVKPASFGSLFWFCYSAVGEWPEGAGFRRHTGMYAGGEKRMQIIEMYSHKGGEDFIRENHAAELADVENAIKQVCAVECLRKITEEKTKPPLL